MCQLNLYMLSKNLPKEDIIGIFQKYNLHINLESYYKLHDFEESYQFYSTSCRCDCDSLISRLREEEVNSFKTYKIKIKAKDVDKLNKIKMLKATKDYEKKVKEFETQRDRLWESVDGFSRYIGDYEIEETKKLFALNLSKEEQRKIFDETVYPKIAEMYNELDNNNEYRNAVKKYQNCLRENADLQDSIYYNIEDTEKISDEYAFRDFYDQFNNLKDIYREILKLTNEICIYPFWQDEEPLEIKNERQVMIENLNIEDLVFLPYKSLLKIGTIKK